MACDQLSGFEQNSFRAEPEETENLVSFLESIRKTENGVCVGIPEGVWGKRACLYSNWGDQCDSAGGLELALC